MSYFSYLNEEKRMRITKEAIMREVFVNTVSLVAIMVLIAIF